MATNRPAQEERVPAKGTQKWNRIRRWAKSISALIAAVEIAAAGIGYITDGVQFFSGIADYFDDQSELRSLVAAADERLTRTDYEAAWQTNAKARELAPGNAGAAEQQARIAMKWLENMRVSSADGRQTLGDVVEPLKSVLIERLADTEDGRGPIFAPISAGPIFFSIAPGAADRHRRGVRRRDRRGSGQSLRSRHARLLDLSNGGPIDKARADFDVALESATDPAYSDMLIMAGLMSRTSDEFMVGAIEYADKIRKAGRNVGAGTKRSLAWYYTIGLRDMDLLAKISAILSPGRADRFSGLDQAIGHLQIARSESRPTSWRSLLNVPAKETTPFVSIASSSAPHPGPARTLPVCRKPP